MLLGVLDTSYLCAALLLQETATAAQGAGSGSFATSFPAGLAAGILVPLLGVAGKYLFDYRIRSRQLKLAEERYGSEDERARWRLKAEARQEVYAVIGSTQSSYIRATMELHERLSYFLENPDNTRRWLRGATRRWYQVRSTPKSDGYYLREFMRRLFNFYA
jgi:hypothetical protein